MADEKPKLTAEEKAQQIGLNLYKSAYSKGKSEGKKESKDPDAKRLGILVSGAVKMKSKGKKVSTKNLRDSANNVKDENDYASIETLCRKSLLMLANATKPVKSKPASVPNPPPPAN